MRRALATILGLLPAVSAPALAQEWDFSGTLGAEARYFTQVPEWPGQTSRRFYGSFSFEGRGSFGWNGGADEIAVAPFLRWSPNGDGRSHADLREAYWRHLGEGWSLTVGVDKVFWGVAESRNPVDIVNQDDVLEDIGGSEKLGQPMLRLGLFGDSWAVDAFVLPGFRPREYPTVGARLASPIPIGPPVYTGPNGRGNVDFALRFSASAGSWDIGLSAFAGTSREPVLVPAGAGLVPRYDRITQFGLDAQYTAGDWLWKLEAITRSGQGPRFEAVTAGFEKNFYGIGGGGGDLALLAEINYDGREKVLSLATYFDKDLFLGARYSLGDIGSTTFQAGALFDRDSDSRVLKVEAQRRFGEEWVLEFTGQFLSSTNGNDLVALLRKEDYLSLVLKRSF